MVPGCLELFLGTFGKLSLDFSCWIPKHILVLIHAVSNSLYRMKLSAHRQRLGNQHDSWVFLPTTEGESFPWYRCYAWCKFSL